MQQQSTITPAPLIEIAVNSPNNISHRMMKKEAIKNDIQLVFNEMKEIEKEQKSKK